MAHTLYIDDSGTKEFAVPGTVYEPTGGPTRYFVFGGLLIENSVARALVPLIKVAKRECFSDESVEIKSNWLRMPHERHRRYLNPYRIAAAQLDAFVENYYSIVAQANLRLIAAVIDKVHLVEKYGVNAHYPPALAYEAVLQRAERELRGRDTFSVTVDDMSGKTPKGRQYKDNLSAQHRQLRQNGSRMIHGFRFTALLGDLRFANSAHSDLIQVADIAAYNVYRQFVDHGEEWESPGLGELPVYGHFEKLVSKFRADENGRIQGYGVVKLPLLHRVPWRLVPD